MSELTHEEILEMMGTLQTYEEWQEFANSNEIDFDLLNKHAREASRVVMQANVPVSAMLKGLYLSAFCVGWKCGQKKLAEAGWEVE